MRGSYGRLGIDVDNLIVDPAVEHVRDEIGPDALDLVRSRLAGSQEWGFRGLHGHDLKLRFALLQHLSYAGDRATGADATDENVDPAVGVFPKLDGGGPPMDLRVGRVLKLLRYPSVRRFGDDLLGSAHRAGHSLRRRGEYEFRAI